MTWVLGLAALASATGCTRDLAEGMDGMNGMDGEHALHGAHALHQSDHFRITYHTGGRHAPPALDHDGDGIPDYIQWVAEAGEHALSRLLAQGWSRPPAYDRHGRFSPQGHYDITISRLDYEGYTESMSWLGDNPHTTALETDVWLARMAITNDFLALGYPSQKEYLQLFVAHELVHLAIAGVEWGSSGALDCAHEWTAAWMESVIYPEIVNNRDYIQYYFDNPSTSLVNGHEGDFDACYGLWLFPRFMAEHRDFQAVRDFWLSAATGNTQAGADIHAALDKGMAGDLARVFAAFAVAVGGTALAPEHAMPVEYAWSGDAGFPPLATEAALDCEVDTRWDSNEHGEGGLPSLAAAYFTIENASRCEIQVVARGRGLFARALIARAGHSQVEVHELTPGARLVPGANARRLLLVIGNQDTDPALSYTLQMAESK
jgi:hypothetical protein